MSQSNVYRMSSRIALFAAFLALSTTKTLAVAVQQQQDGGIMDQSWAAQMISDAERLNKMEQEQKQLMQQHQREHHARLRGAARKAGVFTDSSEHMLNAEKFKALCTQFAANEVAHKADKSDERSDARSALHSLGLANGTPQMKAVLQLIEEGELDRDAASFCDQAFLQLQQAQLEGAELAAVDAKAAAAAKVELEVSAQGSTEMKHVSEHTQATQQDASSSSSGAVAAQQRDSVIASGASASVAIDSRGGLAAQSTTDTISSGREANTATQQQQVDATQGSTQASYVVGVDGSVRAR